MSLNWDLTGVKDPSKCYYTAEKDFPEDGIKAGEKYLSPLTNSLIWATLAVNLQGITEKNVEEWYIRLSFLAKIGQSVISNGGKPYIPTMEELTNHIGLTTNVFPSKTRHAFLASAGKSLVREIENDLRRQKRVVEVLEGEEVSA